VKELEFYNQFEFLKISSGGTFLVTRFSISSVISLSLSLLLSLLFLFLSFMETILRFAKTCKTAEKKEEKNFV